jgi:hypothetical protein
MVSQNWTNPIECHSNKSLVNLVTKIPTTLFKTCANMKANVAFKKQLYHQYNIQNVNEFISSNGFRKVIMHNIEANLVTNHVNDVQIK